MKSTKHDIDHQPITVGTSLGPQIVFQNHTASKVSITSSLTAVLSKSIIADSLLMPSTVITSNQLTHPFASSRGRELFTVCNTLL